MVKNLRVGEVLREYGYITEEQLERALAEQKKMPDRRLGSILMGLGYATERQILEALSKRTGSPLIDLTSYGVDLAAVEMIPASLARTYNLLAVKIKGNVLVIVLHDPLNFYAIEDIRQITQMQIEILLEEQEKIARAIEAYYAQIETRLVARQANISARAQTPEAGSTAFDEDAGTEVPAVQVLNSLLIHSYNNNASDLHIEPFGEHTAIRLRLDGVIVDHVALVPSLHPALIARIKIISNMDIAERRLPQDGHFKTMVEGIEINARVSVIPTVYGEKAVIRFLFMNAPIDHAETYGMGEEDYKKFSRIVSSPHGIVYITGPTGSGKTTTLYMVLEQVAAKNVNVSTIEDPVERNIPRVNQMQVNNVSGLTFESGLRSLLRQDPDVIMVGETRDSETASVAIRAAITGHLVLSTLHTNDSLSSIVRLRDMGVPSYLIANSVVGLVAQRLMRKLCPHCRVRRETTEGEKLALGRDIPYVYEPGGCNLCNNTGYRGRAAVHEVALIDKTMRGMITSGAPIEEIEDYVRKTQNFRTLRDASADMVAAGTTGMEEFYKVSFYTE